MAALNHDELQAYHNYRNKKYDLMDGTMIIGHLKKIESITDAMGKRKVGGFEKFHEYTGTLENGNTISIKSKSKNREYIIDLREYKTYVAIDEENAYLRILMKQAERAYEGKDSKMYTFQTYTLLEAYEWLTFICICIAKADDRAGGSTGRPVVPPPPQQRQVVPPPPSAGAGDSGNGSAR